MRAYRGHWKGKNFVSKIYCYCPWFLKRWIIFSLSNLRAEYFWRGISRTLPSKLKLPLISEEIFNLSNLRVLPAKSKCKMPSDFWSIKGNFKLDGNVLEIALQLYSALRFERLKIIHLFKNQGKKQYIFQTKFFPFQCPRYALI